MSQAWTEEEIKELDLLVDMVSSRNQLERISGRLEMNKFVAVHGKEKCDAMFKYLDQKEKAK